MKGGDGAKTHLCRLSPSVMMMMLMIINRMMMIMTMMIMITTMMIMNMTMIMTIMIMNTTMMITITAVIMKMTVMIMNTAVIMKMMVTVQGASPFVICNRQCLFIWILKAAAIVTRQETHLVFCLWKCEYTDLDETKGLICTV